MSVSIYRLKGQFQKLLKPLVLWLDRLTITPNQVTCFTAAFCFIFSGCLFLFSSDLWLWLIYPVVMLLRMALNALDGMMANHTNNKTELGTVLNEMTDHAADVALYLPFVTLGAIDFRLIISTVVLTLFSELAGQMAVHFGKARRFDGPMGKSDRAFAFSVIALLVFFDVNSSLVNGLLYAIQLLLLATIWIRCSRALTQG